MRIQILILWFKGWKSHVVKRSNRVCLNVLSEVKEWLSKLFEMLGDCHWKQQMFYKKLIYLLFIWKMSHKCLLPSKLTKYNELTNWICSVCFLLVFLFPFLFKFSLFVQPLCTVISLRNDPFRGCLVSRCKSSKVPKVCSRSLGSEPLKSQHSRLFLKDFTAVKKSTKFPRFVND